MRLKFAKERLNIRNIRNFGAPIENIKIGLIKFTGMISFCWKKICYNNWESSISFVNIISGRYNVILCRYTVGYISFQVILSDVIIFLKINIGKILVKSPFYLYDALLNNTLERKPPPPPHLPKNHSLWSVESRTEHNIHPCFHTAAVTGGNSVLNFYMIMTQIFGGIYYL